MSFFERMGNIDRRWIYCVTALVVAGALMRPIGLPLTLTEQTEKAHKTLMNLPEGAKILMGFDFKAGESAELRPQAVAVLNVLAKRNAKVVTLTAWPQSVRFPEAITAETYGTAGKTYGEDWVNLGFYAGGEPTFAAICANIGDVFKTDFGGASLESLPLTKTAKSIADFDLVICISSSAGGGLSTSPEGYARLVNIQAGKPLLVGCLAGMGPGLMPYFQSGNFEGLLVGLKAAAELEKLAEVSGPAGSAMDAMTLAHILIVGLMVIGNISHMAQRTGGPNGTESRKGGRS